MGGSRNRAARKVQDDIPDLEQVPLFTEVRFVGFWFVSGSEGSSYQVPSKDVLGVGLKKQSVTGR